ncbi:MAG: hypothetical protein EOP86_25815 [Verrucomicrobiaceae bacterium]|nr:MAG: hypothetical protein EOP86_25815 [Verrucomicrobiaceae bacterium]
MINTIVGELAKVDLPAAKAALPRLDEGQRSYGVRTIVEQLMRKDIQAALSCARELKDDEAEAAVLRKWAESDLAAVAEELTLGQVKDHGVVVIIAAGMMGRDRPAFEKWTERLADPVQRAVARLTALEEEVTKDPKGTALATTALLAKEPAASAQAGDLPGRIVQRWLWNGERHAEVAAWAAALPQGAAQDTAILEAGRLWIQEDMMQASAWLGSLPQSSGKDAAVLYLVEKITGETPADAFEWVRTVKTPALRKKALKLVTDNWIGQDPAAARQAIGSLSAADRGSLQEADKPE